MYENMRKKGISLVALVITVVVLIILVTATILGLTKNNLMDNSKKAKFMSNFTNVEEGVTIYATSKLSEDNIDYVLPLGDKVSLSEKSNIKKQIPTLNAKIEELSGESIDNVDLYHIDPSLIGAENLYSQKTKGYLIDAKTRQIYDYEGEYFEGLRWHTLDAGVGDVKVEPEPEIWEGWIKLTLFYPSNSTERMWRLSSNGETRTDTNLEWEEYTGPITIPLDRIQDVWIKYKINGKTVVLPPTGTALVDIETDTKEKNVSSVKVNITYDEYATTKEYKVGDGGWKTYTGEFTVAQNCLIEARVVKPDNVYDSNGNLLQQRNVQNSDAYYVGNISVPVQVDTSLSAPIISRLNPTQSDEVAKVRAVYPDNAVNKVYSIDYGVEQNYTDDISIENYGTYVTAYYYTADGKKSPAARILINDTNGNGTINPPTYDDLPAPKINNLGQTKAGEITSISVTYPANAVNKVYTVNGGAEVAYTGSNISITQYRTYVKAYYYDSTGRISDYDWFYVNSSGTTSGKGDPPPPTYVTPDEPTIVLNPTTVTSSTQVSIVAPSNADRIYIAVGSGTYKLYTSPVTVSTNTNIRAYYITYDGKKSYIAYKRVSIIRPTNPGVTMPYVGIDVTPNTGSLINKATVTISSADADTVEYSFDGIVYKSYTGSFDVTSNCTVYARGININGVATDQFSITNIGINPPKTKTTLGVNISATPEPSATLSVVDKVKISIEYDEKATDKYYTIGLGGKLTPYTGNFDVIKNCTIYAYALSDSGNGSDNKIIDNIANGISDPVINSNPNNGMVSSKDKISIAYDKNSNLKQYKIDGGTFQNYTGEFEVTKNCTIYAYSTNSKGDKSSTSYTVTNIPAPPKVITIDYGKYFLLKLNYPPESITKEYKWKENGTWKSYKDAGILLIKPEYKDEFLDSNGNILVKIKDENGLETTFTGDYYLLDVGPSEIQENLFMRWDRATPSMPEIVLDTIESAKEVNVTINYEDTLVKKQYKVIGKDGLIITDWTDYNGPIKITSNNTTVYARGQDDAEVWTSEATKKITNIDEFPPEISLTLDAITVSQMVPVRVTAKDDVAVGKIKWESGIKPDSYFLTGGTEISNNSVVKITSNGYYTFYVEDKAGNTQIYTLNITNVDLNPPKITISLNPEETIGISTIATINYGDSVTKQYKIGANNATWSTYTAPVTLSSYTIITNNWKNSDGTVTLYAKGKDKAGNETTITKKIVSLDLDIPSNPLINSKSGYPIITSYGIRYDDSVTVTYDSRTDIDNYYSIDNGTTWNLYTGAFNCHSGTIVAKSVKKNTGLTSSSSKTLVFPSNAMLPAAYDGNDSTYQYFSGWVYPVMCIDSSAIGKKMRIYAIAGTFSGSTKENKHLYFYNASGAVISDIVFNNTYNTMLTIPAGATSLTICPTGSSQWVNLYEIQLSNEPTFSATNGYMLLHADPTKAIYSPYQMVSINYISTSVQRLYKIGTDGQWMNYQDTPINLKQGQTIYAKGIDKDGNETRVTSSYTSSVSNAIDSAACDGNDSTSYYFSGWVYPTISVDPSLEGKRLRIYMNAGTFSGSTAANKTLSFYNSSGGVISTITFNGVYNNIVTVPVGTRSIVICPNGSSQWVYLYELQVSNEPTFSATNGYMLINADSSRAIHSPYQMVTINYFLTSVQRLYSLDNGITWLNYQDKPVWVNQGQTILAKGIDKYGNVTRIIPSYTANVPDAIGSAAYDNNDSTSYNFSGWVYPTIFIDSSMIGKKIRIYMVAGTNSGSTAANKTLSFYNASGGVISTITFNGTYNNVLTIPQGTTKIVICPNGASQWINLYEIQPSN